VDIRVHDRRSFVESVLELGIVYAPVIPAFGRLRQEDLELKPK
jgi:hypothetical protein